MKNLALIIILGLTLSIGWGQNQPNDLVERDSIIINSEMPSKSKLLFIENCEYSRTVAIHDIRKGEIKILLAGGLAPIVYTTDKHFEEKYQIKFQYFGDLPPKQHVT